MPLSIGSRLGHYDVTALIGEGGMGQLYQAYLDSSVKKNTSREGTFSKVLSLRRDEGGRRACKARLVP